MATTQQEIARDKRNNALPESEVHHQAAEVRHERWAHCHVNWTAVWVGALTSFSLVLVFGLAGIAVGAHLLGPEHRAVDLSKLGIGALIFSVCGSFFSFVAGGWVAGKIAGILHSEPGMLHGAIAFALTVPILIGAAALGASNSMGGWYAGFAGASAASTPYVMPDPLTPQATSDEIVAYKAQLADYHAKVNQWNKDTPTATRNGALGAVTALLLGLIGAVIGGWMASGEPMNFTHHATRKPLYRFET